jgi:predicted RNase H-like HicB family nuclease
MAQPSEDRIEPVKKNFVAYPALLIKEGQNTLVSFPDCPGCQTLAEPQEDVLDMASEALTRWLRAELEDGGTPPQPSALMQESATEQILMVPVPEDLTQALEERWNS